MVIKIKAAFITERMILGHGVDTVIDRIASGLCDLGYECDVYCNNFDDTFKKHKPYNLIRLPGIKSSNVLDLESKIKKLRLLLNNSAADIFLINSFPFYSLAGSLNKPVISINYGIVSTEGMPLKRKLFYRYMDFTQNFSYFRKSSAVVSISNYLSNKLPGFLRKKASCIHLGSDHYSRIETNKKQIQEFRRKLGVKENDCLLLYVGRLNPVNQPYKGTQELIELFHAANMQNSAVKLLMVGFGSQNDEIAIKNEGVLAISNAPWEMMPLIYSSCDIYTTCTKWEGFDLPIVEAQSFGKPSVCYNLCAHPEITENEKTGFLVNTKEEFLNKILMLSSDKNLINEMTLNCLEFSKKFTWEKTVSEYDNKIKKVLTVSKISTTAPETEESPKDANHSAGNNSDAKSSVPVNLIKSQEIKPEDKKSSKDQIADPEVAVVVINYNSSLSCLQECISSLKSQTYRNIEIIIFDNASTNGVLDLLPGELNLNEKTGGGDFNAGGSLKDIKTKVIKNNKNDGLGKAVNMAVSQINARYVLISNFDVVYDRNAVEELVLMMKHTNENVIGLAPKIKLAYQKDYIESVGTYLDTSLYDGYQGLGQLDLHQYDVPEDIFGVSFTSAFMKTEAFKDSRVGKVDETFFLFYEDFDFCFKANLLGYKFRSCPKAVVYHKYSFSFREESKAFETKYYYKRLNLLKMMYKNADEGTINRVLPTETKIMKRNFRDKNLRLVSKRILSDLKKSKKYLLKQREITALAKVASDAEAIKYCWGEQNFFDVVKNEPKYEIANLEKTYRRLFVITGSNRYMEYISYLQSIDFTKFKFEPEILRHKLHSKLENEPISVHEFIDKL